MATDQTLYPCPACGFLQFSEPPGSYEICDVCGWEDDHVQLLRPTLGGGANRHSLVEAQQLALRSHPLSVTCLDDTQRDPGWRPMTALEANVQESEIRDGVDYLNAAASDQPSYYWRRPPGA
jgi:hypothetical protein